MDYVLGIDVGGSGIKGALVDLEKGEFATERIRIPTPESFTMDGVAETIAEIARQFEYKGKIGVGFPAPVRPEDGVVLNPPTAHHYPGWLGNSASDAFSQASGCDVTVANDADVAGLAEMRFGAGKGVMGNVLLFTLGTGVGSVLFRDGILIPNTELGKAYLKGHDKEAEQYMAGRIKEEEGLKHSEWGPRLNEYLQHMELLFTPSLMIIGGGISKKFHKFSKHFDLQTETVPAQLLNQAGIVGAAVATTL